MRIAPRGYMHSSRLHGSRRRALRASWVTLVLGALFMAGGCSSWQYQQRDPGHHLPQKLPIYLAVSEAAAMTDDGGAIAQLVAALESELRSNGYRTEVVAAHFDESPPVPRIELQVMAVSGENVPMQGAGSLVTVLGPGTVATVGGAALVYEGAPELTVDCYVVSDESSTTSFSGRLHVVGRDSGERAGHAIFEEIAPRG